MATTTNYSWVTPDDTSLVKDGAAAIRTLGSSVDTSVKALSPGTTAGDLDYYTTSTAKARLGIGTAGQVLTVNSGATAPEWQTATSGGMTLISTTTLSGASVTLSSIPQTYNNLRLVIRNFLPATDGTYLRARVNADAAANRHFWMRLDGDMSGSAETAFDDTSFRITANNDNAVATGLTNIDIWDYTNTATWKFFQGQTIGVGSTTTTSFTKTNYYGVYNQTSAISSILLLANSGNMTSGTALLYGVK
jgi:hypothetical protein